MRLLIVSLVLALPLQALTVEEVVELSQAGVSDEIIVNQMKADGSGFELSARDIVELQKKKVSPTVINAMVQMRGKPAPKAAEGEPAPIPRTPPRVEEAKDTAFTVRNLAKAKVTVMVYAHDRQIVLVKGEIATGVVLANGSRSEIKVPGGLYTVRWASEDPIREFAAAGGVTTEIELRDDDSARGVGLTVFLDGVEQPDPNAPKVVRETPAPADPEPRVYQSPYNSNVTVIRDIQQAPTRVVIVPGTSSYAARYYPDYADSWGYTSGAYYSEPSCGPSVSVVRYSSPYYYGSHSYRHSYYSPTYYHGSHSWSSHGGHHYSRTADNVQYYLNWPFGHRHR